MRTNQRNNGKPAVLLICPPSDIGTGASSFKHIIDVYQPLGIAYIASVLERDGCEVSVIDAKAEALSSDEVARRAASFKPDMIGMGVSTPDFCSAVSLAKKIKEIHEYAIIIGGRHVSALPEETMQQGCFDYGVIGEGEETIVELVRAIATGNTAELPRIKGIIFRDGSKTVRTPCRGFIDDLDTLPFPARHLFPPLEKYTYLYYKVLPVATIITSRGCPYQCTFCDRAVFGNRMRMRSIPNILDEIELLVRDYGARGINIPDDLFTVNEQRVNDFCDGLDARRLKIAWSCFSRVDSVTPQLLKRMKQAGCWMIGYGIESGSQQALDGIKKGARVESARQALSATRKAGIRTLGFFILGLPGDDEAGMRRTVSFAAALPLDRAVFFITQPFPGSEMYRTVRAQGRLDSTVEFRYYHNFCFPEKLAYVAEGLSIDMLREHRKRAYRQFYLRPAYIFRQLGNYPEFNMIPLRLKAFVKAVW